MADSKITATANQDTAVGRTAEASTEAIEKTATASLEFIDGLTVSMPWLSHWYFKIAILLVIAYLLNAVKNKIFRLVVKWTRKNESGFDDGLIRALRKPFTAIICIMTFEASRLILMQQFDWKFLTQINLVSAILAIYAVAIFVSELVTNYERNLLSKPSKKNKEVNISTVKAVSRLSRLIVYIIATIIVLQMMGLSLSGLLAFGGVGGMVAGLAAKDLLANFFGAAMIYMDKPFRIGDWIRSPDREIEGVVEDIGWRMTRIRTFEKRPLYVPNSTFTTISIENPSRMHNRRIAEFIGVRYDDIDKVEVIVEDVRSMLKIHNGIDTNNAIIVNLDTFAASTVDIKVQAFTNTTDATVYHPIKQDILLKIEAIIRQYGAEIAFPTSTLHVVPPASGQVSAPVANPYGEAYEAYTAAPQ